MLLASRVLSRISLCRSVRGIAQIRNLSVFESLSSQQTQFRLTKQNVAVPPPTESLSERDVKFEQNIRDEVTQNRDPPPKFAEKELRRLEDIFHHFEMKAQRFDRVEEKDLVHIFDNLTLVVERIEQNGQLTDEIKLDVSELLAVLLRCCGKLMFNSPLKARELLAGNLWEYGKHKNLPYYISHYNTLLRVLNENQTSYDPKKILEEIEAAKLRLDRITYQRLIHQYCLQGDVSGATTLLEKMKELGMELNESVFASLIIGYGKQETPPSMTEMFDLMRTNNVEPTSPSLTAAIKVQAGILKKDPTAPNELGNIFQLMMNDDVRFNIFETVNIMACLSPFKDNETVKGIFSFLSKIMLGSVQDRERVCRTLIEVGDYEEASRLYWLHKPTNKGLERGRLGLYYAKILGTYSNLPVEHVINECRRLKREHNNNEVFRYVYFTAAQNGNLELVRATLKELQLDEPLKCQYFWPLIAQAKNEDEVIEVLKNYIDPKIASENLFDTLTQFVWPKFSQNIPKLIEANKQLGYDENLVIASLITWSVAENKIEDAVEFIKKTADSTPTESNESRRGHRSGLFDFEHTIGRLLAQVADKTRDPAVVKKTFNLCQISGQRVSNRSVAALVRVHMINGDFEGALKEFFEVAEKYKLTPCKADLIIHCLENKLPEHLQRIMDLSTEFYGDNNALFDLALCCLICGKTKQAQKIFTNPGFRVSNERVDAGFRQLEQRNNIVALETFVDSLRDMYDVDQEHLYQQLIDVYDKNSKATRALDLWNRMQEEEFQPSRKSLLMIANLLEKHGIEVPFRKPRRH